MPRSKDGRWNRPCIVCGAMFSPRNDFHFACSVECRAKQPCENEGGLRVKAGLTPRLCGECNQEFQPVREKQVFCTRQCRVSARREADNARRRHGREVQGVTDTGQPELPPRACKECGYAFIPGVKPQVFCSPTCRRAWGKARRITPAYLDELAEPRVCLECGSVFKPGRINNRWCSGGCRTRMESRAQNYSRYGLTVAEVAERSAAQGGVCAICGQPPKEGGVGPEGRLHVDHCHRTGRNRAMLCAACNKMIGLGRDNPDVLLAAAAYLELHTLEDVWVRSA